MKKNLLFVLVMMVMVSMMGIVGAGCGDDEDEDEATDGDEDGDEETDDDDDTTDDDDDTAGCAGDDANCEGNLESCLDDGSCEITCTDKNNKQCPAKEFAIEVYDAQGDGCAKIPCVGNADCEGLGTCDEDPNPNTPFFCDTDKFCDRT